MVSAASFEENHFSHKIFATFCNSLGHLHGQSYETTKPIYLSRSRFSGMRKFKNEEKIEEHLSKMGFDIVHPQEHSIEIQLGIFNPARPVCGFIGSAFHNSIFSYSPKGIALCHGDRYSSNFYLMDKINNAKISYVQTPSLQKNSDHYGDMVIKDPEHLSLFIYDLIKSRIWENSNSQKTEHNHGVIEKYKLISIHNKFLLVEKRTGIVTSKNEKTDDYEYLYVNFTDKNNAFIESESKICLTLQGESRCLRKIKYDIYRDGNFVSFLNKTQNRFLSSSPDGKLMCDRKELHEWELFKLVK
ncbi:glycosyltransferase 61 family protein [Acetobacter estunensis]|uniref:glycosyltransferase 61 family protein n=1 Tax=Acetobacter estunensis TaxID=104097 RepID=UPI0034A0440A